MKSYRYLSIIGGSLSIAVSAFTHEGEGEVHFHEDSPYYSTFSEQITESLDQAGSDPTRRLEILRSELRSIEHLSFSADDAVQSVSKADIDAGKLEIAHGFWENGSTGEALNVFESLASDAQVSDFVKLDSLRMLAQDAVLNGESQRAIDKYGEVNDLLRSSTDVKVKRVKQNVEADRLSKAPAAYSAIGDNLTAINLRRRFSEEVDPSSVDPGTRFGNYLELGRLLRETGESMEAVAAFSDALVSAPSDIRESGRIVDVHAERVTAFAEAADPAFRATKFLEIWNDPDLATYAQRLRVGHNAAVALDSAGDQFGILRFLKDYGIELESWLGRDELSNDLREELENFHAEALILEASWLLRSPLADSVRAKPVLEKFLRMYSSSELAQVAFSLLEQVKGIDHEVASALDASLSFQHAHSAGGHTSSSTSSLSRMETGGSQSELSGSSKPGPGMVPDSEVGGLTRKGAVSVSVLTVLAVTCLSLPAGLVGRLYFRRNAKS